MKKCTGPNGCGLSKSVASFYIKDDGYSSMCTECIKTYSIRKSREKPNVIRRMYDRQVRNSKKRGMAVPSYTKSELLNWLLDDWVFDLLYTNWKHCGYLVEMAPSLDRIDDYISYTFSNIRLVTWQENRNYLSYSLVNGLNCKTSNKVTMYEIVTTVTYKKVDTFHSAAEAARVTGVNKNNISECCRGYKQVSRWVLLEYLACFYNQV